MSGKTSMASGVLLACRPAQPRSATATVRMLMMLLKADFIVALRFLFSHRPTRTHTDILFGRPDRIEKCHRFAKKAQNRRYKTRPGIRGRPGEMRSAVVSEYHWAGRSEV